MYSLGSIKTRNMSAIEVKSLKKPGFLRGLHEIKQDIYKQFINPAASDKKLLSVSRVCTVMVAVAGIAYRKAFSLGMGQTFAFDE